MATELTPPCVAHPPAAPPVPPDDAPYPVGEGLLRAAQEFLTRERVPLPRWNAQDEERAKFQALLFDILITHSDLFRVRRADAERAAGALSGMMAGIGALTPLLVEQEVEEIIVRNGNVQVEKAGRIDDRGPMASDDHFRAVALRVADQGGRAIKADAPFVLVDLPSGARFTAVIPPLSRHGTAINIRRFSERPLGLADLHGFGAFDRVTDANALGMEAVRDVAVRRRVEAIPAEIGRFLAWVAATNSATVLISGEFSSGKTTLLNALTQYFPRDLQVAVCETFQELQLQHPYAVRVVAPASRRVSDGPGTTMAEVVNVVYTRMRPDALLIGELVAGEGAEFLRAINLGKRAYATIHGDSALGALYRLEALVETEGLPHRVVREWIARGVDLVVHMARSWDRNTQRYRRFVAEVASVDGVDADGHYRLLPIYQGYAARLSRAEALQGMWRGMTRQEAE